MDPISFQWSDSGFENEVLISDYVLILASKDAREAYNSVMKAVYSKSQNHC